MHFYKPMLALATSKPFNGKDWIFEIKWDGFRAIAYVNDFITIQSRNAKELKHFFPELEELRQLAKERRELMLSRYSLAQYLTQKHGERAINAKSPSAVCCFSPMCGGKLLDPQF
jgi:ATP dependent DNA ligase domain